LQDPVPYHEVIQAIVDQHGAFIDGELAFNPNQGRQTVEAEVERVKVETQHAVLGDEGALLAEMVQEEEQEKEEEKEEEREIEIEKHIDAMRSRDNEEPVPWPFASLGSQAPPQFYPASEFTLNNFKPLKFPPYVYFSNNYFYPWWSGERRIKNMVMALDWVPASDTQALQRVCSAPAELSTDQLERLSSAVRLFNDGDR
jgi:hypothetical protein